MHGELTNELALGAAVALAEGVDGVDLAEVVGGALREGVQVEAFEVVVCLEGVEEGFERGDEVLRGWEAEGVGAGGGDFAEVAGPGEDVLEDVVVDGAEVANVEEAGDGLCFELENTLKGKARDMGFQRSRIANAKSISEYAVLVVELAVKENDCHGLEFGHSTNRGAELLQRDLTGDVAFGESDDLGTRRNAFGQCCA
jgi:hypothetical protein